MIKRIALSLCTPKPKTVAALNALYPIISTQIATTLSPEASKHLNHRHDCQPLDQSLANADALLVIGGDGSILAHAPQAIAHNVPVLGIHCGRLGFLTDVLPNPHEALLNVLAGDFWKEARQVLAINLADGPQTLAVNEVVLSRPSAGRLLDFELQLDRHWGVKQRADGMIVATPTGSTAYALSAGGPICHPSVQALLATPICAHHLTSRPIVLPHNCQITLHLAKHESESAQLTLDGQRHHTLHPGQGVTITTHATPLQLMHPNDYNYFSRLSSKLHWERAFHAGTDQSEELSTH